MDSKNNPGQRIFYFPATKIFIGLIACMAIIIAGQAMADKLLGITSLSTEFKSLAKGIIVSLLLVTVYTNLYKFYEKRKINELSSNRLAKNLITGILLGGLLQSLTISVIYLNKGFSVIAVNSFVYILPSLATASTVAIIEEILFRGIIFRITEEKLGSYLALAISAIIFGALHLMNTDSTIEGAWAVAIEAGLLLGAAIFTAEIFGFPLQFILPGILPNQGFMVQPHPETA